MIFGNIKDAKKYMGLNANLDAALAVMTEEGIAKLVPGRNEINGDEVFVNKNEFATKEAEECVFEAHKQYADIHLILEGSERIGFSDVSVLEAYKEDWSLDYALYNGPVQCMCDLKAGDFLIVLPEEGHKLCMYIDKPGAGKKCVFKVKM